jgi:hypothetical protein
MLLTSVRQLDSLFRSTIAFAASSYEERPSQAITLQIFPQASSVAAESQALQMTQIAPPLC